MTYAFNKLQGNDIDRIDTDIVQVNAQLADIIQQKLPLKRDKSSPITSSELDTSTNSVKIKPINVSDELMLMFSPAGTVNPVIPYKSIGIDKVTFSPLKGKTSKNLLNKETVILGKYVAYDSGVLEIAADNNASDFIEILPNTDYHKNTFGQFAFYDEFKIYISGSANAIYNFKTPKNSKFIRLTLNSSDLVTGQLELGNVETSYESYGFKLDKSTIIDKTINESHLDFTPIKGVPSKNLFDKTKVTSCVYVNFTTGGLEGNADFLASDFIAILGNTKYTKTNTQQFAFYDSEKAYISGLNNITTFTTPSNAKYIRVSVENNILNTFQLELGEAKTAYDSFGVKVDVKNIPSLPTYSDYSNVFTVGKTGAKYKTINQAMAICGDTKDNPVIIDLLPGIYVESLQLVARYITIVGRDKNTCIIKTFTNDYYYPPIDLSTNSHLSNLTIIADDDGITTPPLGVHNMPAYTIHFDISGRGFDNSLPIFQGESRVQNCILISKHQHAVGIGIGHKQHLIFENCEFIAMTTSAFRAHNYQLAGGTNEKMTVKNCTIYNNGSYPPIVLQDPNTNGGANDHRDSEFTFINNVVWSENGGQTNTLDRHVPLATGCVAGYIKLGKGSFGNSIPALNA